MFDHKKIGKGDINVFLLQSECKSPYWMTFRQAGPGRIDKSQ